MFEFVFIFAKEGPVPPLQVLLKDHDTISGDDEIGHCVVDLTQAIEGPCKWSINQAFDIIDPEDTRKDAKPQIFLQAYWVPEGTPDPNIKPKDKDTDLIRDDQTATGYSSGFMLQT